MKSDSLFWSFIVGFINPNLYTFFKKKKNLYSHVRVYLHGTKPTIGWVLSWKSTGWKSWTGQSPALYSQLLCFISEKKKKKKKNYCASLDSWKTDDELAQKQILHLKWIFLTWPTWGLKRPKALASLMRRRGAQLAICAFIKQLVCIPGGGESIARPLVEHGLTWNSPAHTG